MRWKAVNYFFFTAFTAITAFLTKIHSKTSTRVLSLFAHDQITVKHRMGLTAVHQCFQVIYMFVSCLTWGWKTVTAFSHNDFSATSFIKEGIKHLLLMILSIWYFCPASFDIPFSSSSLSSSSHYLDSLLTFCQFGALRIAVIISLASFLMSERQ